MKIFFDHQAFSLQNYGGISRYYCELIAGINSTKLNKAHLSLLWSNNIHLKEHDLLKLPYPFQGKYRILQATNTLFNVIDASCGKYDIYHATYFNDFLAKTNGKRTLITTFYDMTYERLSHRFTELAQDKVINDNKKRIAQSATHLIAISESTKNDMVELLGISPEKISVIYLASSFNVKVTDFEEEDNPLERPYILYVGNRSGYKNFETFLKASSRILIKYKIKLICAGGGIFNTYEKNLIRSLLVSELVEYVPINDEVLPNLYRGAIAFIFPSLYEGFGIPILESFSCDCPCVLSDNSSLPEVAGNAALYIDPLSEDSIVTSIERLINEPALRIELIKKGRERLKLFSWTNTVQQTLKLYQMLV